MTLFQIILLVVDGLLLVMVPAAITRRWVSFGAGLLWAAVCLLAGVAVAIPESTKIAARALGVQRGADLVIYCSIVVMMIGFLMTYTRLRALRREVTLLTRELAIRDAARGDALPGETTVNSSETGGSPGPSRSPRSP
jgi:hypothetical protein